MADLTTAQVLGMIRRHLSEVDETTSAYTDGDLMAAVSDQRDLMEAEGVPNIEDYVVVFDDSDDDFGIAPDLTLQFGVILALRAAADILMQLYRDKVKRGELGGSWESALESESTINTQRAYRDAISDLEDRAQALLVILRAPNSGFRAQ